MGESFTAEVWFTSLFYLQRRHHPSLYSKCFELSLKDQSVHNGAQHTGIIGLSPINLGITDIAATK
ncbi:MAG: hypothetical protein ACD_61C00241G0001 [uncultured bacterium]|nr:MAG: hypothetical protein ACD_61C00241G0001 [uncultured bacterium]